MCAFLFTNDTAQSAEIRTVILLVKWLFYAVSRFEVFVDDNKQTLDGAFEISAE